MSRMSKEQKQFALEIVRIVPASLGVTREDYYSSKKVSNHVVDSRFIAILLIKEFITSACDADIAYAVKKNRATVFMAKKSASNYLETDERFREKHTIARNAILTHLAQAS